MTLRLIVLHTRRKFSGLVMVWGLLPLSARGGGVNCEVYGVRCVLSLPDCQTVRPGLKFKENQDVSELIILGFDIKLLELDKWYKAMMER
jgi:hypothetical protein